MSNKLLDTLITDFSVQKRKSRRNLRPDLLSSIFKDVSEPTKVWARKLLADKWQFLATSQRASWSHSPYKQIAISDWAINSMRPGYKEYVICHEMAHAFAPKDEIHGARFMSWLQRICPPEYIHYELEYKPRNAASAGITLPFLEI